LTPLKQLGKEEKNDFADDTLRLILRFLQRAFKFSSNALLSQKLGSTAH